MARTSLISKEAIAGVKKLLAELKEPEKLNFSLPEAIEDMKDDIKSKLDLGHSPESIVDTLNRGGMKISITRFKTIWGKLYPSRKRRSRKSKNPSAPDSINPSGTESVDGE